MAYYNRRKLLINTLNSINQYAYNYNFEIVIIDDGSKDSERIEDLSKIFNKLNLKIFRVIPSQKWWVNPCIPNNIGFGLITGDVVIIQNPECLHLGNIIDYVGNNIKLNKYLVFGCYAIDQNKTNLIQKIVVDSNYLNNIKKIIMPVENKKAPNGWYQHSKVRPCCYNFCTAMHHIDLKDINGFDEKFANGIACDDSEFCWRICSKGMNLSMIDSPFTVHQWHGITDYSNKEMVNKNKKLYSNTKALGKYKLDNKLTEDLIKTVIE